jgi:peptide/nickel transport system substrate-binding protein
VVKGGAFAYGSYPDIDALFQEQAGQLDRSQREAMLHKIQQLVHDRTIFAHLWQLAFINGAGPRVGESGLGLIATRTSRWWVRTNGQRPASSAMPGCYT